MKKINQQNNSGWTDSICDLHSENSLFIFKGNVANL